MTKVDTMSVNRSITAVENSEIKRTLRKDGDNIFAATVRNTGMDMFADFLRDDWTANTARKVGFNNFADWLDNKSEDGSKKDSGFFSNIAREAIKHPVVTLLTVSAAVWGGKKLYNALKKAPKTATTATTTGVSTATATASLQKSVPQTQQNLTPAQLREVIGDGLKYEQQIGFANLEILKDVSPEARKRILNHFNYQADKERFVAFASGAKPGLMEKPYSDDVFDALRSNTVKVIEAFSDDVGTLILNQKEAEKIIAANKTLFAKRLGLPETTSVAEIFKTINKASGSPLVDPKNFSDLRQLLIGATPQNAMYSQILQDITNAERHRRHGVGFVSFYKKSASGINDFKQALRDCVTDSKSSYANMSSAFKDDLLKMIDSITPEEYANRLSREVDLFQDVAYNVQKYNEKQKLAMKLENARLKAANIGFD